MTERELKAGGTAILIYEALRQGEALDLDGGSREGGEICSGEVEINDVLFEMTMAICAGIDPDGTEMEKVDGG